MSAQCIFCKIVRKELPASEVARSEHAVAFRDLNPQAPLHVLVVPAYHADNLGDYVAGVPARDVGELFALASRIGREHAPGGYRVVVNEGDDGGQTVHHLHLHVLGRRALRWPPG